MRVRISEAARMLGVSVDTLRRWEAAGKIEVERTPGGHRRYEVDQLKGIARNRPAVAGTDRAEGAGLYRRSCVCS